MSDPNEVEGGEPIPEQPAPQEVDPETVHDASEDPPADSITTADPADEDEPDE